MPLKTKTTRRPPKAAVPLETPGPLEATISPPLGTAPPARPQEFSETLASEICERIAFGETLRHITLLPHLPEEATLYRWLLREPEFQARFLAAKALQVEKWAEELIDIADDARNDWIVRENGRAGTSATVANSENVQRAKLRVVVRQWLIARWQSRLAAEKAEAPAAPGGSPEGVRVLTEERRAVLMARRRAWALQRLAERNGQA
jgi:hypothetical protein